MTVFPCRSEDMTVSHDSISSVMHDSQLIFRAIFKIIILGDPGADSEAREVGMGEQKSGRRKVKGKGKSP